MPRRRWVAILALLASTTTRAVELRVEATALGNGLRVIVHPDHSAPAISSFVFFRAGSRNETRGQTGIAHLFEHMMFNGGRRFGPGVFDDLIEGNGGATNGFTTRDMTAYVNEFPTEALPLVLDLEADRIGHLAITPTNLEQERGIVAEERRLRIDNDVFGSLDEALYLAAFVRSPYRWNTVGFMADIQRITLEQARAYFHTYYAPNNAILVLAGDVEPSAAFRLAREHFGAIPRRPPPAAVDMEEPPQDGERRVVVRRPAELPAVLLGYHAPEVSHADRPALDVLAQILAGGESARFDLDLVREHEVATTVHADSEWGIGPELFTVYAQARPGTSAAAVLARIDAVVERLAATPVPVDELAKAKRQLRADFVKGLKTVSGKAMRLGYTEVLFGDYRALFQQEAAWEAVTADDVRRVTATYLVARRRTIAELEPERLPEAPR